MDEGAAVATETYLINERGWTAARPKSVPVPSARGSRALGWSAGGMAIVAFIVFALAFTVAANDARDPDLPQRVARALR